jgi:hypothetical protein
MNTPKLSQEALAAIGEIKPRLDPKTEFVLGAVKSAILRIDEIRQELINAGVALKAGYITPQQALDWAEEFAPGCVGYVPPLSGLGLKRVFSDEFASEGAA